MHCRLCPCDLNRILGEHNLVHRPRLALWEESLICAFGNDGWRVNGDSSSVSKAGQENNGSTEPSSGSYRAAGRWEELSAALKAACSARQWLSECEHSLTFSLRSWAARVTGVPCEQSRLPSTEQTWTVNWAAG